MSYRNLVNKLIDNNITISTMESCTGGGVSNAITNIEGASEILRFSAVTYSNEYKIKMGVSPDVIDKYSVYSQECADEMSFNISKFSNSSACGNCGRRQSLLIATDKTTFPAWTACDLTVENLFLICGKVKTGRKI